MYDLDSTNPWDWTDYIRLIGMVFIGVLFIGILIYFVVISMPEPILCCQCCCP